MKDRTLTLGTVQEIQAVQETRRQACAMVEAMVALARALGMRTVAEGIENEAQFVLGKEIGCDAVHGCFIGKPGSAARIDPFAETRFGPTGAFLHDSGYQ
ncbi:EAL domain-containing protein [Caballeronia sp. LZ028]|nr:EAL domain-containing protein [Caballeronia sp. LZ028]MDR5766124.1 EAL domain-containing protein [Caballeronia sp. LZ028]